MTWSRTGLAVVLLSFPRPLLSPVLPSAPEIVVTARRMPTVLVASYYASVFHGRLTASGRRYNERELTAAALDYPFGTWLRLRHRRNGRTVCVQITDKGPFAPGRGIDLSRAAARQLGMIHDGLAEVEVEVL